MTLLQSCIRASSFMLSVQLARGQFTWEMGCALEDLADCHAALVIARGERWLA